MAAMVHFDHNMLRGSRERAVYARNKWESVPLALNSVKLLAWDARYSVVPEGLQHYEELAILVCSDCRRVIADFKHQQQLADYREMELPRSLSCCYKLKVLDLSFTSFFHLSSCWQAMRNLRIINVSYNQSLLHIAPWIGEHNRYLRSLNVMGCSRVVELPRPVLERLNTCAESWPMRQCFTDLVPLARDIVTEREPCSKYEHPTSAIQWLFADIFKFLLRRMKDGDITQG